MDQLPTEPLREEHRHLLPHIEALAEAADSIGSAPLSEQRQRVEAAVEFLQGHLIPHAEAEDRVLYEEVDSLIGKRGATGATATMRRDHVEVGRLTERLSDLRSALRDHDPSDAEQRELRRLLYGLHTLVKVHFAKEEEVYLPLLDRELTADEARSLFARMGEGESVSSGRRQATDEAPTKDSSEERQ